MSDAISAETTVEVDYSSLVQTILDEASSTIEELIDDRVGTYLSDNVGEAVEDYLRYNADISDMVNDCMGDALSSQLNDALEELLEQVGSSGLCNLGNTFKDAVHTILEHHIDDWNDIFDGQEITNGNGASTEDIQKMVAEKFNKEMKVEVTFVDKEPAAVMDGPPSTNQEGYTE